MKKKESRCVAHNSCSRRDFISKSAAATAGALIMGNMNVFSMGKNLKVPKIGPYGSATSYVPKVKVAFVRREEDYGLLWPGQIYDGEAARKEYTEKLKETAKTLDVDLDIRPVPLYSIEESDAWIAAAKASQADGLMVFVLDRQKHSWPTAYHASDSGIPTIIFSPLGTSFTTNTTNLVNKPGCVVYSTNDFSQAAYGMKMLKAGAQMKRTRCVVIRGDRRKEVTLSDTGITLQYVPAESFIEMYNNLPISDEVIAMTDEYLDKAQDLRRSTRQDVLNGIKSYLVAGEIMKNEKADSISMDCLGALGDKEVSLPCIAWSRMNDDGIPAACEGDTGAIAAQIMVQYLFDRPGFQQDPVADTSDDTIIGAHCSCPTRLSGFTEAPEPFEIIPHHGDRDAVPRTLWEEGKRITCLDVFPGDHPDRVPWDGDPVPKDKRSTLMISTGTVMKNMSAPPSGGCVVSVKVKFDDGHEVLNFPGMHQLFFYGEYKSELEDFSQLYNFHHEIV